jgi:hypothetical protein
VRIGIEFVFVARLYVQQVGDGEWDDYASAPAAHLENPNGYHH